MAEVTSHSASEFEDHPGVSSLCPSRETSRLSMADLERVMVDPNTLQSTTPDQVAGRVNGSDSNFSEHMGGVSEKQMVSNRVVYG